MIRIAAEIRNTVLAVAMVGVLSGGCSTRSPSSATSDSTSASNSVSSTGRVKVEQEPISLKKEFFDRDSTQSSNFAAEHNQSANTHWRFQCVPRFRFEIIEKKMVGKPSDNLFFVKLRITDVIVYLAAPVTIVLPKLAKPEVASHEDGHFKICKRVYDTDARPSAQAAAEALMGQEFVGTGKSLEEASQIALHHAAQQMGREFRSKTIDYLDRVSAFYDQLTPQHPESKYVDACVEAAFKAEEKTKGAHES